MRANDPLPSWNDTGPKKAIVAFVDRVTTPGSPEFVLESDRIATFDNDRNSPFGKLDKALDEAHVTDAFVAGQSVNSMCLSKTMIPFSLRTML